jgi:hypothetical protein
MTDYQLICDTHGTIALVASPEAPTKAMCYACGDSCRIVDSGAHAPENYR